MSSSMILVHKIHPPIFHVCNKCQASRPHSSGGKCDEKFFMFENWRERKMENKGMNNKQQPDSGIHDTCFHCPRVYQISAF